jgi:hypothetical protein
MDKDGDRQGKLRDRDMATDRDKNRDGDGDMESYMDRDGERDRDIVGDGDTERDRDISTGYQTPGLNFEFDYLCYFETEFEKNRGQKSRATVPLKSSQ